MAQRQSDDSEKQSNAPKLFAIYKKVGPSSHDMMYRLKRLFPGEKVGHAGTLDPLASGILVVGIGRAATKQLHLEEQKEKEYVAEIRLGQSSSTDDAEGAKTEKPPKEIPTSDEVAQAVRQFIGTIQQRPPAFSALKVAGTPAYKLARQGKPVELASRPAVIKEIEVLNYDWPVLRLRVVTGRGVYIRSLARDIGEALGSAGFISALERTRVGPFTLADAISLDQIKTGS